MLLSNKDRFQTLRADKHEHQELTTGHLAYTNSASGKWIYLDQLGPRSGSLA